MTKRARIKQKLREINQKYTDPCYRIKDNEGHYEIARFGADEEGNVTAWIIHGRDSYFPGVMVFGVELSELVPCGCGEWEPATEEQLEQIEKKMEVYRDLYQRGLFPKQKAQLN